METSWRANKLDPLSYMGNKDFLKSELSFNFYSHPQLIKQIDNKNDKNFDLAGKFIGGWL